MTAFKESTLSFASGFEIHKQDEGSGYDDISTPDLREMLKQIVHTNWILKVENGLFERFLLQNSPQSLETLARILETPRHTQKLASQAAPVASSTNLSGSVLSLRSRTSPSAASSYSIGRYITPSHLASRVLKITLPQRIEMANREIEGMKSKLRAFAVDVERKRARLRAKLEEVELRIRETVSAMEDLEESVVRKGIDRITGKIPAEKFVRFMDDWLKVADAVIDRVRMKKYTVRSRILKAKQQLAQREDLGETLRPVDFEQLRIENLCYVKEIEEKNRSLLDMKKTAGFYNLDLTRHKEKLNNLVSKLKGIRSEVSQKKLQIEKLQVMEAFTVNEVKEVKEQLESVLVLMDKYEVPDILDFLRVQEDLARINRIYKRLEREKNIVKITYHAQRKHFKSYRKKNVARTSNKSQETSQTTPVI